ncbi:MAG: 2-hydroxyacid dehydrogenase [marine bacterium B5-7]|nr:MAG: 2-hydroxyacid dehydrogenase [marine bacterium B5-7]
MPDIVISEFMDESAVQMLKSNFSVRYDPDLVDDRPALEAAISEARGLVVRNRTQVNAALIKCAPDLEVVGRLGVGLDNIDLGACATADIAVCPALGANAVAVAEYVIAVSMILFRPVFLDSASVIHGGWPREAGAGRELGGKTLGLVGYGTIARETARRAIALDMRIAWFDPNINAGDAAEFSDNTTRYSDLADLAGIADVVSIHVPLNDSTDHLIDRSMLKRMKPSSILVNTSRGGIVDEEALVEFLNAGNLAGAALDVFEHEPLNTVDGTRFSGVPNLLVTPHIAGVTDESNVRVGRITAENVIAVLARAQTEKK